MSKLSLEQFTRKVGEEAPNFARALQEEDTHLQVCKKVREDLKQLRDNMKIRQADIAANLQISQSGVSKIESGEGDIGLLTLCRYAGALGMQPTVTFSPAASTYLQQDTLRKTVRAMERLSESRGARADVLHNRYRDLAAAFYGPAMGNVVPPSAMMGALASAISGVAIQSISTEIASIVSVFSENRLDENDQVETISDDGPHVAAS